MGIEEELRAIRHGLEAVVKRLEGRLGRPVALSMEDAAHAIGVGKTKFKQMVNSKVFTTFRVDRRRLVRMKDLEDWAERESVTMVSPRMPKTRRKTEAEKLRAAPRR